MVSFIKPASGLLPVMTRTMSNAGTATAANKVNVSVLMKKQKSGKTDVK